MAGRICISREGVFEIDGCAYQIPEHFSTREMLSDSELSSERARVPLARRPAGHPPMDRSASSPTQVDYRPRDTTPKGIGVSTGGDGRRLLLQRRDMPVVAQPKSVVKVGAVPSGPPFLS
jgi:hypothetical protein